MPNADAARCPRCGSDNPGTRLNTLIERGYFGMKCRAPWHDSPDSPAPRTPMLWVKWYGVPPRPQAYEMDPDTVHKDGKPTYRYIPAPPAESPAAGEGLIERVHDKGCLCGELPVGEDGGCIRLRAAIRAALDEARSGGFDAGLAAGLGDEER